MTVGSVGVVCYGCSPRCRARVITLWDTRTVAELPSLHARFGAELWLVCKVTGAAQPGPAGLSLPGPVALPVCGTGGGKSVMTCWPQKR